MKGTNIEILDKMKILGTNVDSKLSWDDNCSMKIRKVNARMELMRSLQSFGASAQEMVHMGPIVQKYFRAVLYCVGHNPHTERQR